ncbi:insulinase family protein [Roseateles sp. DAIF2]|uniref:M16 family metallopeptidase n=1 Tax=Roseateles sp. DAIF2 TaxID=2714952 RepID=UPI0018A30A6C|nr:M16 family metallopeptidase [Roseateles sp. DAIF2]QPF73361.1 insulinase family protein [Roseateles sp. DAIF2]
MTTRSWIAGLMLALLAGLAVGQTAPPPLRELGGISEYRLANGLQVLLFPDASRPSITVNLVYRVGSRHEGAGEAGMAHLLEHLLFRGTPEFPDIPGELSRRGIAYNGSTTADRTNYFSSFNADEATLAFMLKLEANRMLRSRILQADLEREMPVVRNELEIGENNPAQLLRQRVLGIAYRFHPYGQPTIGTLSDLQHVPIERLREFYRLHYRPDNAVLMVAGQVDPARALALIEREFGALPRPMRARPEVYTVEPPQDGERVVSLRRVGGAPLLVAAYHVPALAHPDCAALALLTPLLVQSGSGSLHKALVEGKLANQVFAGGCGGWDPGLFHVGVAPAPGVELRELEQRLFEELESRSHQGFAAAEVQRAVTQFELGYRQILKQPERAVLLLSEAVAAGDWRLIFKTLEEARRVTPEDLRRVATRYLRASNRSYGRYLPVAEADRVEVPPVADRSAGLDALRPDQALAQGEAFDLAPAELQARTRRLTLPSGIRLALLPKRNRGEAVSLQMRLRWAALPAVQQLRGAAFVDGMLTEGSLRRDRQALMDEAVRLRGSFVINAAPQGATIRLQAERDTLLPLLALLQEVLQQPAFPEAAFARLKTRVLTGLEGEARDPDALRQEEVRLHYNRARGLHLGQPDYLWSRAERAALMRATELADVREFHRRYWSANEAEIAVVGTLPEGLETEIERLFGGWKKPGAPAFERWSTPYVAVPPLRVDAQADDKANAVLQMRQELQLSTLDTDYLPLVLANRLLGGGLDSRLAKRLRHRDGLSYRHASELQADRWDRAGAWLLMADFAPEQRERVLAAIREEVDRLLAQGFEAEELERVRLEALQARQRARSEDGALLGALLAQLDSGEDWLAQARDEERLRGLSLAELNAALRRHLRPEAWVISTAGDYRARPPR